MDQPLVSVIIPSYNRAYLLPRAIASVFSQTYSHWELIISDDGSSDGTEQLVANYSKSDDRVRYLASAENRGPSAARNRGIAQAKGKYIAFLDSDDEWLSHHLSDSLAALEKGPAQISLALWYEEKSTGRSKIDEPYEGVDYFQNAVDELKPEINGNLYFFDRYFYEYALLEYFFYYQINTVVLNVEIIRTVGQFNENLIYCEDTEFLLRVFRQFSVCFIKDYHFIYYQGNDNLYAFIDRQNLDLEDLSLNRELLGKWNRAECYKIKVRSSEKRLFHKRGKDAKHKEYSAVLTRALADKCFTLGYINRRIYKKIAFRYYLQSLYLNFNIAIVVYIGRLFFPRWFNRIQVKRPDLNLW